MLSLHGAPGFGEGSYRIVLKLEDIEESAKAGSPSAAAYEVARKFLSRLQYRYFVPHDYIWYMSAWKSSFIKEMDKLSKDNCTITIEASNKRFEYNPEVIESLCNLNIVPSLFSVEKNFKNGSNVRIWRTFTEDNGIAKGTGYGIYLHLADEGIIIEETLTGTAAVERLKWELCALLLECSGRVDLNITSRKDWYENWKRRHICCI